jgi:A/G-specific adenine glycosylase
MLSSHRLAIRRKILRWYDQNKRDLPWRRSRDPYVIWIAETMLQQTQVKTVMPYFEKFLTAFPTVEDLARAPRPRVLRHWSGLGYYRRAVNLHRAARQIIQRHGGQLPQESEQLKALAGIGDYTAGALLSIAFNRPYAAVDGNVRRVLSRLCGFDDERRVRRGADVLVPATRPGDFNQAMMELGATVCTPRTPRCPDCPLRSICAAVLRPSAAITAKGNNRKRSIDVVWPLAIVHRGSKILLRRRAAGGLLAGLWEIPGGELARRQPIAPALAHHLPSAVNLDHAKRIGVIRHAITHRRIRAPVYLIEASENREITLPGPRWRWVKLGKLPALATSAMTAKAVRLFFTHEKNFL